MEEKNIIVQEVAMSTVGNYISVKVDNNTYKSTAVSGEFTKELRDAAMNEIYNMLPEEDIEAVEFKYSEYLVALENARIEAEYRAAHPEEFEVEEMMSDEVI